MTNPLVPTPIVDKNGRLTTVHKKAAVTSSTPRSFPAPDTGPDDDLFRTAAKQLELLISGDNYRADAAYCFRRMDKQVVIDFYLLAQSENRWLSATGAILNHMLVARADTAYMEMRMRHMLAVAPLINEGGLCQQQGAISKVLNAAARVQKEWSAPTDWADWVEDSASKAKGAVLAICVAIDSASGGYPFQLDEDDALWIGEHAEDLIPHYQQIVERKALRRGDIEPLLASDSKSLSAGML